VAAGRQPGLLAYDGGGEAVGWVSVAPREEFLPKLERSPTYRPVPGGPAERVWSLLCFVVKVGHRRQGTAAALLEAAVRYAREHGAAAVEGYPVDTGGGRANSASVYVGVSSMFRAAGFTEIDRRGTHPVYRLTFDG
jgi:GNAT superfamily N-acetyltransferase